MHDTEAKSDAAIDLEDLVDGITMAGNLGALIAFASEEGLADDPDRIRHAGARVALQAYAVWKQTEGRDVPIEVVNADDFDAEPRQVPEILPLSLLGKGVAWSSDGMRIVGAAETIDEAERLALESGEAEPILERPMRR